MICLSTLLIHSLVTQSSSSSNVDLNEFLLNRDFSDQLASWNSSNGIKVEFDPRGKSFVRLTPSAQSTISQVVHGSMFFKSTPAMLKIEGASSGPESVLRAELRLIKTGEIIASDLLTFKPETKTLQVKWNKQEDKRFSFFPAQTELFVSAIRGTTVINSLSLVGPFTPSIADDNGTLINQDFKNGFNGWYKTVPATYVAKEGGFINIRPANPVGGKIYEEELFQFIGMPVQKGQIITVVFKARSEKGSKMKLRYCLAEGDYSAEIDKEFKLTPTWKDYTVTFISKKNYEPKKSAISFQFGYGPGSIDLTGLGVFLGQKP